MPSPLSHPLPSPRSPARSPYGRTNGSGFVTLSSAVATIEVTTAPAQMGGRVSRGPAFLLGVDMILDHHGRVPFFAGRCWWAHEGKRPSEYRSFYESTDRNAVGVTRNDRGSECQSWMNEVKQNCPFELQMRCGRRHPSSKESEGIRENPLLEKRFDLDPPRGSTQELSAKS